MGEALGQALAGGRVVSGSLIQQCKRIWWNLMLPEFLNAPEGHPVQFVTVNGSGSKLDDYLNWDVTYAVGRCPKRFGCVHPPVVDICMVNLRRDVPVGLKPPDCIKGSGRQTPGVPTTWHWLNSVYREGRGGEFRTERSQSAYFEFTVSRDIGFCPVADGKPARWRSRVLPGDGHGFCTVGAITVGAMAGASLLCRRGLG